MDLSNFFDKNDENIDAKLDQVSNYLLPAGDKDKEAGVQEVLHLVNHQTDQELAEVIFLKSLFLSRFAGNFGKDGLKAHLSGYCLEYFNDNQIGNFHKYLTVLANAQMLYGSSPSHIKRTKDVDPTTEEITYVDESWLKPGEADKLPVDTSEVPEWMWIGPSTAANFSLTQITENSQATTADEIPDTTGQFGLDSSNPIPTYGIAASTIYLSQLFLASNGNRITWQRHGAIVVENINKPIDIYDIFDPEKNLVCQLHISPYHKVISSKIPDGFAKM